VAREFLIFSCKCFNETSRAGGLVLQSERERERESKKQREFQKWWRLREKECSKVVERKQHCRQREREVKNCICVSGLLETTGTGSRRLQPFHRPHRTIQPFCEFVTPLSPFCIRQKVFLPPKPLFCLFNFMEQSSRKLNMQKFVFDDIKHKG